jgi:hypothetical protein
VGAILLVLSLFLNWYKADRSDAGLSGWTVFEVLDLVLVALAVLALIAAAERLGYKTPVPGSNLTVVGGVALAIVLSQLIDHPPAGVGLSPDVGIWLALGASGLIVAGGILGRARISVEVVVDRARERRTDTTRVESAARAEAAAEEPKVERQLYGNERGDAPLGANDPEPFRARAEDETRRID